MGFFTTLWTTRAPFWVRLSLPLRLPRRAPSQARTPPASVHRLPAAAAAAAAGSEECLPGGGGGDEYFLLGGERLG